MKASALKHKPVVSMADGQQIGQIEDVLFDTAKLCVAGFALSGSSGRSILPFGLARVGPDAVTVDTTAAAQPQAAADAMDGTWRGLSELTELKVVNAQGVELGEVREVEIDEQTGRISQLDLHRGGVLGLGGTSATVAASAIRGIGPQLVTVDAPVQ